MWLYNYENSYGSWHMSKLFFSWKQPQANLLNTTIANRWGVCKYQSTISIVKLAGAIGRTVHILSAKNTDRTLIYYMYIITYNLLMVNLCVKGQRGSWDDEKCLLDMFCLECHIMKVCVLTVQVLDTVRDRESLMGWSFWGFPPCLYFACLARVDWLASNPFYSSSFVVVAWVECFNVFALMYLFF